MMLECNSHSTHCNRTTSNEKSRLITATEVTKVVCRNPTAYNEVTSLNASCNHSTCYNKFIDVFNNFEVDQLQTECSKLHTLFNILSTVPHSIRNRVHHTKCSGNIDTNPSENHQFLHVLSMTDDIVVQVLEYLVLNPLIDVPVLHKLPKENIFQQELTPVFKHHALAKPKAKEAKQQAIAGGLKLIT
uniref:Uncharacterized protein n=1 Tax=Glossina austeni TaxID=7395 RepID=A0A1A9VI04_GLOAU